MDNREVELKLEFDPADRALLADAPLFAGQKGQAAHLVATYFDTPALDLHRAGFSLRVRRKGRAHVQTIKADGGRAAGLFARSEWEKPVDGNVPLLDAIPGPLDQAVGAATVATADKIFVTDIERTVHRLDRDGQGVECAIDIGRVRVGRRATPLAEVELELLSGEPALLFSMARQLNDLVPLRLGMRSKSDRGYALLAKERRKPAKAEPIAIAPDATVEQAFRAIAQGCIRQFRLNEDLLLTTGAPGALHQARVGLRRLRSALSIFAPVLAGDPALAPLKDGLRALAATLGRVRNIDVLLPSLPDDAAARLALVRAEALADAELRLQARETRILMLDLAEWLALGDWCSRPADAALLHTPVRPFAAEILSDRRKRLKRKGKNLVKRSDERRHQARIAAKKLRYASEFFAPLFPKNKQQRRHAAFSAMLEKLQDDLGALNDLATAPATLAAAGIGFDLPAPDDKAQRRLLRRAEKAYAALLDTRRFWG